MTNDIEWLQTSKWKNLKTIGMCTRIYGGWCF